LNHTQHIHLYSLISLFMFFGTLNYALLCIQTEKK
jgi:hypothetical protein